MPFAGNQIGDHGDAQLWRDTARRRIEQLGRHAIVDDSPMRRRAGLCHPGSDFGSERFAVEEEEIGSWQPSESPFDFGAGRGKANVANQRRGGESRRERKRTRGAYVVGMHDPGPVAAQRGCSRRKAAQRSKRSPPFRLGEWCDIGGNSAAPGPPRHISFGRQHDNRAPRLIAQPSREIEHAECTTTHRVVGVDQQNGLIHQLPLPFGRHTSR